MPITLTDADGDAIPGLRTNFTLRVAPGASSATGTIPLPAGPGVVHAETIARILRVDEMTDVEVVPLGGSKGKWEQQFTTGGDDYFVELFDDGKAEVNVKRNGQDLYRLVRDPRSGEWLVMPMHGGRPVILPSGNRGQRIVDTANAQKSAIESHFATPSGNRNLGGVIKALKGLAVLGAIGIVTEVTGPVFNTVDEGSIEAAGSAVSRFYRGTLDQHGFKDEMIQFIQRLGLSNAVSSLLTVSILNGDFTFVRD